MHAYGGWPWSKGGTPLLAVVGEGDRNYMPDGFWLLKETGVESTDWGSKGAEPGGGASEVWKSSCVGGDRAKARGSLETCLAMWRSLGISIIKRTGWGQKELKISSFNHGFFFPVTSPHPGAYTELLY